MQPVKLGIIGTGIAARELHLPALRQLSDKFTTTCVCNHTEAKAKSFSELLGGVPYVLDYRDLLAREDVEAVDIAVPIPLNYQMTKDALTAGKHVMVEKPMAANLDEAHEMLGFEREYPRLVKLVGEPVRYAPIFLRVKKLLDDGEIGEVYSISREIMTLMTPANKYAQTPWRIHHTYRGGFITDGGVHHTALIRDLCGEIVAGNSFTVQVNPALGEMDTFSLQFKTDQNIKGLLTVFLSAPGCDVNRLTVFGRQGTIIVDKTKLSLFRAGEPEKIEQFELDHGFKGEFVDFYGAIRTGSAVKSSFIEGYRDLEAIMNALDSADAWINYELTL